MEFYKKAAYYESSPVPEDLLMALLPGGVNEAGMAVDLQSTESQPLSTIASRIVESRLDTATAAKRRQDRDQLKDEVRRKLSSLAATKKKSVMASAAKAAQRNKSVSSAGLTDTSPNLIPPVVPQSTTMKGHLISLSSDDTSKSTAKFIGESSVAGSASIDLSSLEHPNRQDLVDTKIDFAQSCIYAKNYVEAGAVIGQIPENKRTVKVYLMLIQLCRNRVVILPEKVCWECIAEIHPLAIEAYVQLLRLQVPLAIVLNMIPSDSSEKQWMKTYLQGMDSYFRMKYQAALSDFSVLDEKYPENTDIKLHMAICLRWMNRTIKACFIYSQVRKLDTRIADDMYHYASCLKQLSKTMYLNKLARDLMTFNDNHPDTWCVQALYWEMKGDKGKALQMVSRALQLKPDHCGALQLRGQLYLDSTPQNALQSFREAHGIEKDILTFEGLVDAYISLDRHMEAVLTAKEAKRLMPDSANALAIYGSAIYHAGSTDTKEVQDTLLEALRMDPACILAASSLVIVYGHQDQYEDAIQVLDQQLDYQPPDVIHLRKAEIYTTLERWEEAHASYLSAMSANPNNIQAKEGMANVEKILSGGDDEIDEEELEMEDEQDIQDMGSDLDHRGHAGGQIDEEDILTGEEDQGTEYDEHHSLRHHSDHELHSFQTPHHQQQQYRQYHNDTAPPSRVRGLGQTPRTPTRNLHSTAVQSQSLLSRLQSHQVHRQAVSVPGFGMAYPQTPTASGSSAIQTNITSRHQTSYIPEREREYDEYEDGGED
ncbi:Anaphase-promoting complex subunit 7 [Mortierella polycephala]|uniref:Anaphase-promoting complex subunit 7 n=1 Tax=Mortierella polycephala TaxID=41804 RepID=A0A9P6PUB8_9FUNG|nr:Anaphase-promoting complex subunit 7 [Mortierella polycephala]